MNDQDTGEEELIRVGEIPFGLEEDQITLELFKFQQKFISERNYKLDKYF